MNSENPATRWAKRSARNIEAENEAIQQYPAMKAALQAMLDAYSPGVNWSRPERLHSAVRIAGELLGHCKKG